MKPDKIPLMATRKYYSEFGLYMSSVYKVLLQQDGIPELDKMPEVKEYPCHIYIICRRPRITLDPNEFVATPELIKCRFNVQRLGKIEHHDVMVPNYLSEFPVRLNCPYPHTEFSILNVNDQVISRGKVALLAQHQPELQHLLNLEVLYIGQSYGDEGSRTAPDRLISHSTLQRIYAELIKNSPDQEVWITVWSFEEVLIMNFDGREPTELSDDEDDAHTEKVIATAISEQQRINFTEAALIKYFESQYNTIFKGVFPNPAHTTYSECYEIDLNVIGIEIETEDIGCQLWSPKVPPLSAHYAFFPLHSPEKRKNMLDLL